jgi:hypothetical protein
MIKLKMKDLLNVYQVLSKIGNNNSYNISIQFKFKVALLIQNLKSYIEQYNKELQTLIKEYEIKIEENKFVNNDESKLKLFLEKLNELENIDLEIENKKIKFDKNMNGICPNEIIILMPFFDFEELEG